jgi:hypothetical protein
MVTFRHIFLKFNAPPPEAHAWRMAAGMIAVIRTSEELTE